MIEIKNLNKIYRTKGAPDVHALVDVSIKFENTGMVFILGKSGSGKSTFLNVVGGLDSSDSGEIIIKGKSSKDFNASDFDSYRNTYLGFVFQEYNLIDEFTIGHNIGLALELQHKKATPEAIEAILKQVDMEGYADRMPSKISGGQKQRVAIARALIKEPQIIMADEPTGALDSVTGEQIFQTLKKLSRDKLVMVVSHDRDYAERYGDRIVEFKDGRIISDMIRTQNGLVEQIRKVDGAIVSDNLIKIPAGTTLTPKHTQIIQEMLQKQGELIISADPELNIPFKENLVQKDKGTSKGTFVPTKDEMLRLGTDKTPFKLIKSRLPAKSASKMAKSSMKHKRGRLIFSIILAVFSIVFFGFSSVVGGFKETTALKSVVNSYGYDYIKLGKTVLSSKQSMFDPYGVNINFTPKEIDKINDITGGGVARFLGLHAELPLETLSPGLNQDYYLNVNIHGAVCSDNLDKLGLSVPSAYGRLPENPNEILISNYIAEQFMEFGLRYRDNDTIKSLEAKDIKNINDILNYKIALNVAGRNIELKIVGIINFGIERYAQLKNTQDNISKAIIQEFRERKYFDISYIYGLDSLYDLLNDSDFNSHSDISMSASLSGIEITSLKKQKQDGPKVFIRPAKLNMYYYNYNYLGADGSTTIPKTLKKGEVILNLSQYYYALDFLTFGYEAKRYNSEDNIYHYDHNKLSQLANQLGVFNEDFRLNTTYFVTQLYSYQNQFYIVDELKDLKVVGVMSNSELSYDQRIVILSDEDHRVIALHQNPASLFVHIKNSGVLNNISNSYIGNQKAENKSFAYYYDFDLPFSNTIIETSAMFSIMSIVFFWISITFSVFAALLLLNFISTSVAYKRKEIGVLRAIGAKRSDVVSIFMFEGLYISIWILSFAIVLVFGLVVLFNNLMTLKLGIPFSVMSLGLLDIIYMCLLCFVTVSLASILPVYRVSSLKPMDAIRGK